MTNKYNIVLNCTYSNISKLDRSLNENKPIIKHEIAELVLVDTPIDIKSIGITIMDGPFFSLVPFPSENCHSLSHVRYTPHYSWTDNINKFPDYELINYVKNTRFSRMRKDSSRYIPLLRDLKYNKSLFEIKSVLNINESDDGRPILFKENPRINGLYSILGAKIDNIYDIFEALNKLLM